MPRVSTLSKNREFIFGLLSRASRFHCPVTTTWRFDVDSLSRAVRTVRVSGKKLGITACLVKATSLVLARHPQFNQHLFHGVTGKYVVAFDTVCCTLVVMRRSPTGERMLLPLLIDRSDELDVAEIQRIIDQHRFGPLEELPQFRAMERLKRLPRFAISWFSYKARSDHEFYRKYFGTYGLSQMAMGSFGPESGHLVANTAAAFVLGPVTDRLVGREGQLAVRKSLAVTLVADHYLIDGLDMLEGMRTLDRLLSDPSRLGVGGSQGESPAAHHLRRA